MWSKSLFFISNRFNRMPNNFGHLSDRIVMELSCVVTMAPAVPSPDILRWPVTWQWHREDDWNCCVSAISDHTKINPKWVVKMTQIAYSGSFWTQFRVSRDLFTDLTAGKATVRNFLQRNLQQPVELKKWTCRKIITYQTPNRICPLSILFRRI